MRVGVGWGLSDEVPPTLIPCPARFQTCGLGAILFGRRSDLIRTISSGNAAQTLERTLKQAGDNLTRENVIKQALSLSMPLSMLYPNIDVQRSAKDSFPIDKLQLIQLTGSRYGAFGSLIAAGR